MIPPIQDVAPFLCVFLGGAVPALGIHDLTEHPENFGRMIAITGSVFAVCCLAHLHDLNRMYRLQCSF